MFASIFYTFRTASTIVVCLFIAHLFSATVLAESDSENLQKKITQYQDKIEELQGQASSLSNQIEVMDSQIQLTEYRITATQNQITSLSKDIKVASSKVNNLEGSLDKVSQVLFKRIIASYQLGVTDPMKVFFASEGITDYMRRVNYIKIVRRHDQQLLINTQQAKNDYQNQKNIFEEKKLRVEQLNSELEGYTLQLDNQKIEKQNLLTETKNSEGEYQNRLSEAMRELRNIQKAASVLISTEPRHVTRGERIGTMGSSGYAFGAHLHFGIYNISSLKDYNYYSNNENPVGSLESRTVKWDTGCGGDPNGSTSSGTGSFSWPMSTENLVITQSYGHTCYSDVYYSGNPHPALDMYNNSDAAVLAVEEGEAYFCRNCTGDGGNGVFLFHPNGKMSLYWHLQ